MKTKPYVKPSTSHNLWAGYLDSVVEDKSSPRPSYSKVNVMNKAKLNLRYGSPDYEPSNGRLKIQQTGDVCLSSVRNRIYQRKMINASRKKNSLSLVNYEVTPDQDA